MIRVLKMSNKFYGIEMSDDIEFEMEEIETFITEGNPIIIVNELEDLYIFGIEEDEVTMVTRD